MSCVYVWWRLELRKLGDRRRPGPPPTSTLLSHDCSKAIAAAHTPYLDVDQTRRSEQEGMTLSVTAEGGAHECVADGCTRLVVGLIGGMKRAGCGGKNR